MRTNQVRWAKNLLKSEQGDHRDFMVVNKGVVYDCPLYFQLPDVEDLKKGSADVHYGMAIKAPGDSKCRSLGKAIAYTRYRHGQSHFEDPATALWGFVTMPKLEKSLTKSQLRRSIAVQIFKRARVIATKLPHGLLESLETVDTITNRAWDYDESKIKEVPLTRPEMIHPFRED